MRISDSVANYILQMLNDADGIAEIQRNELANVFGCVPSQINYVITSRFTPEQGYIVESRRGGGGYIRITRRRMSKFDMVMHIVNAIGQTIDAASARAMLQNLVESGMAEQSDAQLIAAALSDAVQKLREKPGNHTHKDHCERKAHGIRPVQRMRPRDGVHKLF